MTSTFARYAPPPPSAGPTGPGGPVAFPQTVLRTFRDAIREISPWWLRGPVGGSILYAIGSVVDGLADAVRAGVKLRFPSYYSDESLPLIGRERRIRRGRFEVDSSYARRLLPWLDHHRLRGGPYALLAQINAFYSPRTFPVALWYASGRQFLMQPDGSITHVDNPWLPPDEAMPRWARWWLVYVWPDALSGDGIWSDPGVWTDGGVWDLNMSPSEVRDLRVVPREWNAAHSIGYITLNSFDAGGITVTISVEAP